MKLVHIASHVSHDITQCHFPKLFCLIFGVMSLQRAIEYQMVIGVVH